MLRPKRAGAPREATEWPPVVVRASLGDPSIQPATTTSAGDVGPGDRRRLQADALPGHFTRLYRAAYALCGRREDAEDLVQETYARVLSRPRFLRREDDLPYLLRVMRNTWIRRYRVASTQSPTVVDADVEFIADPRGDPTVTALELKAIYDAMRELPQKLRETVVAVDVLGLSYRQAARALGTREGTIMSRLYRARERIASELDPHRPVGLPRRSAESQAAKRAEDALTDYG
jgi:RNA polymerase sigma-70 factor (ECF subfamily)